MKATVSGVVEDLKFKILESSDPAKLKQLTGQGQENTNLGPNLLKF